MAGNVYIGEIITNDEIQDGCFFMKVRTSALFENPLPGHASARLPCNSQLNCFSDLLKKEHPRVYPAILEKSWPVGDGP